MSHLQKRIALLKQPAFVTYMISCFFASLGNGIGYVAISWVVVTISHNKVSAMAILLSCFWIPNIIISPLMGILADRLSRKTIITISCFARATFLTFFSFYLKRHLNISFIYLMMFCNGVAFSAFFASAFGFMRELVSEENLIYANATVDIIYEIGNVVGMGFAGILIAMSSAQTAILFNGFTFLAAALCMFFISNKSLCKTQPDKHKINVIADFKSGLQYLRDRKPLKIIYTIQLLILVTFLTTPLLLVPFSKTVLHATAEQFGLIETFASAGIIIGGLLLPWISERLGLMQTLLYFSGILCVTFAMFGYNHIISVAMIFYFIIGFSGSTWPLIISKAQSLTDLTFQGRVQSTFNSLSGCIMLLFYFSIGLIGKLFSVHSLYWVEFAISATAIIFLLYSKDKVQYN